VLSVDWIEASPSEASDPSAASRYIYRRPGLTLRAPARSRFTRTAERGVQRALQGSPIKRARRRGLLRDVAVALGNWGSQEAIPALAIALNDEEPLVRGHAAWALGRIGTEAAMQALRGREEAEADPWVREEIAAALGER
jgi:epoxyqueuosine reductase